MRSMEPSQRLTRLRILKILWQHIMEKEFDRIITGLLFKPDHTIQISLLLQRMTNSTRGLKSILKTRSMKKLFLVLFLSIGLLGCSSSRTIPNVSNSQIHIYRINQFSSFLLAINCEGIKSKFENKSVIEDNPMIQEFEVLKRLASEGNPSELGNSIDTRLLIEFLNKDTVQHQFCWSMSGFSFDGVVYLSSSEIDSFLVDKNLIIAIE